MSSHVGHFRVLYACGLHVKEQCRCIEPSKDIRRSTEPCPEDHCPGGTKPRAQVSKLLANWNPQGEPLGLAHIQMLIEGVYADRIEKLAGYKSWEIAKMLKEDSWP